MTTDTLEPITSALELRDRLLAAFQLLAPDMEWGLRGYDIGTDNFRVLLSGDHWTGLELQWRSVHATRKGGHGFTRCRRLVGRALPPEGAVPFTTGGFGRWEGDKSTRQNFFYTREQLQRFVKLAREAQRDAAVVAEQEQQVREQQVRDAALRSSLRTLLLGEGFEVVVVGEESVPDASKLARGELRAALSWWGDVSVELKLVGGEELRLPGNKVTADVLRAAVELLWSERDRRVAFFASLA